MQRNRRTTALWFFLALLFAIRIASADSAFEVVGSIPLSNTDHARLHVTIHDASNSEIRLAVRAIIATSDGSTPDGSGHGVYADGRFFADGAFDVDVPPGDTRIELSSGPEYVPLAFSVEARPGISTNIEVALFRWFNAAAHGWYCGDNHVHAQHDPSAAVQTGLDYAALQGRGNGLNFITEAGSNVSYDLAEQLDTPNFLLRVARELRPACYTGHLIAPGIREPIPEVLVESIAANPLPGQALKHEVHARGGAMIYTHPLTPAHQLHWMGATGAFSDAVLGNCADLMDIDSPQSELLWFTLLNLGNRIGASSYTDCALGRAQTLSPGDRRLYCQAPTLDYGAFVQAMTTGRTFATNGGPVFPFFTIDGHGLGEVLAADAAETREAALEVHTLHPLRSVVLIRNGVIVKFFDAKGNSGAWAGSFSFSEAETAWYVLRAEDNDGNWGITSPIYFQAADPPAPRAATALLLEINNADRYTGLRKDYFAHIIATVSPEQRLQSVALLRKGGPVRVFEANEGDSPLSDKAPVTTLRGDYAPGWRWHGHDGPVHFQADWPVKESGWYRIEIVTTEGVRSRSHAMYFDAAHPNSHELSVAQVGNDTSKFVLWGYGEEMALDGVQFPFEGDHWWYPNNASWGIGATFDGVNKDISSGQDTLRERFRS